MQVEISTHDTARLAQLTEAKDIQGLRRYAVNSLQVADSHMERYLTLDRRTQIYNLALRHRLLGHRAQTRANKLASPQQV